jgi:hypothetical protein
MKCVYCREEIHPLRLKVLPNTKACVKCSKEGPRTGEMATLGEGDHTYQELIFTSIEKKQIDSFRDDEFIEEDA